MSKGKGKKEKSKPKISERVTRKQRRAQEKSNFQLDPEDLDAQLRNFGLCTKNIAGDGNCLFRSLSDQYYGEDRNHKLIRQEVCQYLRENEETYKFFVEDDQSFDHHIECMSRNATYGGNMELVAFAKLKRVDIKVFQPGLIYVIKGVEEEDEDADEERQVLHIAYHSWEHYSSIRNIDGPHSGPPEIKTHQRKAVCEESNDEKVEEEEEELDSKEKVVMQSCPGTNIRKIRRLLRKYKGDPDKAIDAIYESEFGSQSKDEDQQPVSNHSINDTLKEVSIHKKTKPGLINTDENKIKQGLPEVAIEELGQNNIYTMDKTNPKQNVLESSEEALNNTSKKPEPGPINMDENEIAQGLSVVAIEELGQNYICTMDKTNPKQNVPESNEEISNSTTFVEDKVDLNQEDLTNNVNQKNSNILKNDEKLKTEPEKTTTGEEEKLNRDVCSDKAGDLEKEVKKKKPTAAQRKAEAKKKQKEKKLIKEQEKAARRKGYKDKDQVKEKVKETTEGPSMTQSMKEMYI